jgi:DNA modification methylase
MRLISGDCIEAMRELPDASVDAIVTDPPYGLGFMGKAWDDLPPGEEWGRECLRVLKPGGHLLAFGGSRTYHRLACAVEDAGFEVRDQMMWLYGSGFPKSLDVSKAVDDKKGCKRNRVIEQAGVSGSLSGPRMNVIDKGKPITPEAEACNGWGTALKPAHEPIVVARKPLAGTVAENVLAHGTGALNIDGCRIGTDDTRGVASLSALGQSSGWNDHANREVMAGSACGRWPANVVLDEEAGRLLDEQSGERPGGAYPEQRGGGQATGFGEGRPTPGGARAMGDTGGASRFFYCAKASKGERNAGLDELPVRITNEATPPGTKGSHSPRAGAIRTSAAANHHPTVKPISLMRYLVRLVTPPEGTVLDPFLGSGTTGCAAVLEGFNFIGIEREAEYLAIAQARIEWWEKHRGDGATEEILKAAGVRDEIEAGGQLGLLEDAA